MKYTEVAYGRKLTICTLFLLASLSLPGCSDFFGLNVPSAAPSELLGQTKSALGADGTAGGTTSAAGVVGGAIATDGTSTIAMSVADTTTQPAPNTPLVFPSNTDVVDTVVSSIKASTVVAPTSTGSSSNWMYIKSSTEQPQSNVPFQFGRPFIPGEIPQCPLASIEGTNNDVQANVMTRHEDGSVKFAIFSVVIKSLSSTKAKVSFTNRSCPSPAAPLNALAEFPGFDAGITINGTRVSARNLASTGMVAKTWLAGPLNTTIIYADHRSKASDLGSTANRFARPIFEVQFWPTIGKYRVRYIIENSDTEKIGTDTGLSVAMDIASDRKAVASIASMSLIHSSRFTRTAWSDSLASPAVDVDWNVAYLAATKALPNYDSSIAISRPAVDGLLQAWNASARGPGESGLWLKGMPETGGRADLGPFPRWMVAALYDGRAAVQNMANGMADLAASWPMHLREGDPSKRMTRAQTGDLNIGRPVSFYARPTLARPGCNGYEFWETLPIDRVKYTGSLDPNGWNPDTAHMPQPYFIPYLLTGEHFYMEQLQFWGNFAATWCGAAGTTRNLTLVSTECWARSAYYNYAGHNNQTRGQAWSLRAIAEAGWATPDNDTFKAEFSAMMEDKISLEEGRRGLTRASNSSRPDWNWGASGSGDCERTWRRSADILRFWFVNNDYGPGAGYGQGYAPWQYGFMMYSLTRSYELGYPTDKLREWMAKFFVGAVTDTGANPYLLGSYVIPVKDLNGDAFRSWSDVNAVAPQKLTSLNDWRQSGSITSLDQGYGTVALNAIANSYGVASADTAWSRFAGPIYQGWGWGDDPKWAILPRTN